MPRAVTRPFISRPPSRVEDRRESKKDQGISIIFIWKVPVTVPEIF
ncbi:MAG: hypothetical protein AVDCRST_MAG56-3081 [uncultured Cytophagales bacterium]|uniref:Uncharacterized protein n=1 Tax=uncultured Cytophagales bacterium TaxID=158755 RepID=A0A6J4J9B4_9SPHI|nr:MAG: hypothetical protein AVDCRST_MAG56-3081 [uncultured Cytophagales bacterium]